jgi:hypothetical protein
VNPLGLLERVGAFRFPSFRARGLAYSALVESRCNCEKPQRDLGSQGSFQWGRSLAMFGCRGRVSRPLGSAIGLTGG